MGTALDIVMRKHGGQDINDKKMIQGHVSCMAIVPGNPGKTLLGINSFPLYLIQK